MSHICAKCYCNLTGFSKSCPNDPLNSRLSREALNKTKKNVLEQFEYDYEEEEKKKNQTLIEKFFNNFKR